MKSELIRISARLLERQMSCDRDDYPKNVPNWVLRNIETQNEKLKQLAVDVRKLADSV